jgi:hypothetical protein
VNLQNNFTTGDNRYPNNCQQTLHLFDKCSKTVVTRATQSEGTSFSQRCGRGGGRGEASEKSEDSKTYNKKWWKNKKCYKCHKKGHPSTHFPKKSAKDDDNISLASTAISVDKLKKDLKFMKKAFTTVNTQLALLKEADSDISYSEGDEEASYFHMDEALQIAQVDKGYEPGISKLFKQNHGSKIKLDLREVILLDTHPTTDIFCNSAMVGKTIKSASSMRLKRNGGTIVVTRKAYTMGYHKTVWFRKKALTNIIALRILIQQYRLTYDSDELMFVVHRESESKPNMEFRMHEWGLHYHDPRKTEHLAFVNTVSENEEGFTKRQIKGAETARALYTTLSYPSMKDFKWMIRSNHIKDCPVTVQGVDVTITIWGKNIAALKGNTMRSKTNPVARDYVKVPMELLKLHKEVFLTTDIFFVNKLPFFLTVARSVSWLSIISRKGLFRKFSSHSKRCINIISSEDFTSRRRTPMVNSRLSSP